MSEAAVGGAGAAEAVAVPDPALEEEKDDGYKVAAKVDLKTMVEKDSEDESLRKYKAALLGAAASGVGKWSSPSGRDLDTRLMQLRRTVSKRV